MDETSQEKNHKLKLFGREYPLPQSRLFRGFIGIVLVMLGLVGFLPVVGFWMIPLGLLVLSYDFAFARRWRRKLIVWYERREKRRS